MRHPAFLTLAVATLASLPIATGAGAQVPDRSAVMLPDGAVLDVVATGRTSRVPDVATIRAGVVTQAPTAAAAMSDNAQRTARVLAAIRKAGVAERDVQTATISLQPQYRYVDGQAPVITGYQGSNSVSVRFRDIAKSGAILDALVAQGANQIDGPNLSIDRPEGAMDAARTDAIARARARAELYARAAGLRVERIVSISESGSDAPVPPPVVMMRAAASQADTQIAAGEQDVTVSVSVRFLLK